MKFVHQLRVKLRHVNIRQSPKSRSKQGENNFSHFCKKTHDEKETNKQFMLIVEMKILGLSACIFVCVF